MLSSSIGVGRFEQLKVKVSEVDDDEFVFRADLGDINSLAGSIERYGLLQPLILRLKANPEKEAYELLAGHRRLAACRLLGFTEVPAILVDANEKDAFILALTENVQSKSLNPIEEAMAFQSYIHRKGWGGASELARNIGKSPAYISLRLQLLQLPDSIRSMVASNRLAPFTAAELHGLSGNQAEKLVTSIGDGQVSLRRVRKLAKEIKEEKEKAPTDLERYSTTLKMFILSTRRTLNEMDASIHRLNENGDYYRKAVKYRYDMHRILDSMVNEYASVKKQLLVNEL
ncbi:MAG: ParB/RepB/Spo0J family partition protein [Nitrososphaerota archaeon]|jgi:ParB family chromosome partitioning protein|nr:ParB/RepB/Spo0J family partition protein [Nitrososphaerota archaeon]MDG7046953.1 ParB/RepB/Spo0J family partition protein [Nitrososphaerota archaeon]